MRVVIVDGDISYPATSGKRLRTMNLMLRLADRHRITYIARGDAEGNEGHAAREFLSSYGIKPVLVHDPVPQKQGIRFYGRLAANMLSAWPYSVTSHQSRLMQDAVTQHAAGNAVDLWQLEWSAYMPVVEKFEGPKVVVAHNVDTLIWQRYHETAEGFLKRLFIQKQWQKFDEFERWALARATRVVAVSEDDADLLRTKFGVAQVDVVENGIDREFFSKVEGPGDPKRILFLGAMDWRPNLDAAALLLNKIFPAVLAHEPEARLVIVGRNPPRWLVERAATARHVELHADVPNVRRFLAGSGVMAVPLRIGGGSRLKILEALACGLPVVSTRVGAEGLQLVPSEDFIQAEEGEMTNALVQAIRQPQTVRALADHGRKFVLEHHDWGMLARKLEQTWERCFVSSDERSLVVGR